MGNIERTFLLESNVPGKYKFICRECSRETTHIIVAAYKESGSQDCGRGNSYDWNEANQIIQCQGCEAVSFRVESTNSEDYDYDHESNTRYDIETIKFYPGRSAGLKAIDSYLLPLNVQDIYKETILAIENEQNILAGIGIRALIETICKDLNAAGKDLYNKINSLQEQGIVTKEGVETLHKLRVLGNDAAHEVKKHNQQQLSLAIQIIEHMLDGTYIIPHKVAHVLK
ncbi:DUF4145 domain-containing protein [Pseudomonas sp. BMS12]|uniref:DUF4145 domain-containing protein n=1 Tax=Pseudomonas sp. BMS12 TaxID=1796033 RepID=UPI00083AC98A|nr:DUF4145 domain-containing protein [Pseudomonas sp. BMS12]